MEGIDMTTRILKMYEALERGREVYKQSFCMEYGISERTFDRDIEKIRLFLSEEYSGKEVEYDSKRVCYRIPGNEENGTLTSVEVAIIIKLLKGEGALEKNEFEGLLKSLGSVTEHCRRRKTAELIQKESGEYEEKDGHGAFLKLFGDLQKCISDRNIIRLKINKNGSLYENIKFFPVAVEYLLADFYLLGYQPEAEKTLAVFRLKEIESFQMTIQKYKEEIAQQYSYHEGRRFLEHKQDKRKGEKTDETY